jgi:hypothetical protein
MILYSFNFIMFELLWYPMHSVSGKLSARQIAVCHSCAGWRLWLVFPMSARVVLVTASTAVVTWWTWNRRWCEEKVRGTTYLYLSGLSLLEQAVENFLSFDISTQVSTQIWDFLSSEIHLQRHLKRRPKQVLRFITRCQESAFQISKSLKRGRWPAAIRTPGSGPQPQIP